MDFVQDGRIEDPSLCDQVIRLITEVTGIVSVVSLGVLEGIHLLPM